jgi:methylase of polypeptide subunit release factors
LRKTGKYEPKEALFAKDNGTFLLKEIVKEGTKRKVKMIICEMGYHQKPLMEKYFIEQGINNFYFYKDLSGNYRGFVVKLNRE